MLTRMQEMVTPTIKKIKNVQEGEKGKKIKTVLMIFRDLGWENPGLAGERLLARGYGLA